MTSKKLPTATKAIAKKVSAKKTSNEISNETPLKGAKQNRDGLPLSAVIRRRIEAQKARFHANDNIFGIYSAR
jgi:GTP cyclohydrolase I